VSFCDFVSKYFFQSSLEKRFCIEEARLVENFHRNIVINKKIISFYCFNFDIIGIKVDSGGIIDATLNWLMSDIRNIRMWVDAAIKFSNERGTSDIRVKRLKDRESLKDGSFVFICGMRLLYFDHIPLTSCQL
jgi:hypothetical protein